MLEALTNLHFVRPLWLLMVLPCVWLLYRFALYQKNSSGWSSAIDAELLQVQLAPGAQSKRRGMTTLLGAGLVLGVIALAGPAWERLPQPVEQKREALVIVLDLSLSMYAQDLSPSRLVRARQKITDVLRERTEGFTAMVAYAGDAHAVAPLTDDTGTIENLVAALSPSMMPALGSNVGLGIEKALELLANAGVADGRILLFTDGVDNIGDVTRHSNPRIPISIIGVGTTAGASIPLDFVNQPGRILRDEEGDAIQAKLDAGRLANIAELCHGFYSDLSLDMRDITTTLPPLDLAEDAVLSDRAFDAWADIGPWLVLLLVPLMLLAFRRGALAVLVLGVAVPDAQAGLWDDLWQRKDQQAYEALNHGAPEAAATLFENPDWKAAAQYRAGEFDKSTDYYTSSVADPTRPTSTDSVTNLYNLANSLVQTGQLDEAIKAYDQVLESNPDHEDAAFNKALVEQAQQEQQGESSDEDNQESQEDSDKDSEQDREQQSQSDGSDEQQQDDSQEQDGSDQQEGEETEQSEEQQEQSPTEGEEQQQEQLAQEATEEQKAAMEQWLRRVPDEPGGLLRRKFKYETDQRRREGNYQPKARKIW